MPLELLPDLVTLLKDQKPIKAAWLIGSFGRGDNDAFSDLDILTCVDAKENLQDCFQSVFSQLQSRPDVIFAKTIMPSHTINAITESWERFDITFVSPEYLGRYPAHEAKMVFGEETGLALSPRGEPDLSSLPRRISELTEEFIRILGLLPIVLGRGDYVIAQTGVQLMKDMLITLMRYEHLPGIERGKLSLKKLLPETEYRILHDIPVMAPKRESILELNLYIAGHFLSRAKALYKHYNLDWPRRFEQATLKNIKDKTGLEL